MKETRVANRYAKALFELALEMSLTDQIRKDSELLLEVCAQNNDLVLMLRSPIIKDNKKISVVNEIFSKKLQDLFLKFLTIIINNRREEIIIEIAEQYIDIYKTHNNIVSINIETATQIDIESRQNIISVLEQRTDTKVELTEEVKEELIGGFVLSTEDKQYDASIQRQLKNLRKEFNENLYVKGF